MLTALGIIVSTITVAYVTWQMAAQLIFTSPSILTGELSRLLFIYLELFDGVYTAGQNRYLAIGLLPMMLKGKARRHLFLRIQIIVIIFTAIIMVYDDGLLVMDTFDSDQIPPVLGWQVGYIYMSIPINDVLIIIYTIDTILVELKRPLWRWQATADHSRDGEIMSYWLSVIMLFGVFSFILALDVPTIYATGLSTLASISIQLDFDSVLSMASQRLVSRLDGFTLSAIPLFILSGNIMNHGRTARWLINFTRILGGHLPGSPVYCDILANMLLGVISGSAVTSAAAMSSITHPQQAKEGYGPVFNTAVDIASAPTGLLILPNNTLIVCSLVSDSTSIITLSPTGYVPGTLLGLALMVIAGIIAIRRDYPRPECPILRQAGAAIWMIIPNIFPTMLIMDGMLNDIFTPTEVSAIAVIYTLFLALVLYREILIKDLSKILLEPAIITITALLLIGPSIGMSWVILNTNVLSPILDLPNTISDNPIIILLIIDIILLIIGTLMGMTPTVLISTPIFLPVVTELDMNPIRFGIVMVLNMCIGIYTLPIDSVLFVGCNVSRLPVNKIIKPMLSSYAVMISMLAMMTYIPQVSMALSRVLGYWCAFISDTYHHIH